MFCSQCGKKVLENMLYCPFCGSAIVIPEQEQPELPKPVRQEIQEAAAAEGQKEAADGVQEAAECAQEKLANDDQEDFRLDFDWEKRASSEDSGFVPLDLNALVLDSEQPSIQETPENDSEEEEKRAEPDEKREEETGDEPRQPRMDEPVKLEGRVPNLVGVQSPRSLDGHKRVSAASMREFDPDDMFLDGDEFDEEDEYDEPKHRSFFVKHVRGIVSLSLCAVLIIVVLGWLFSGAGQKALARADLAWDHNVYAELAREAYANAQNAQAGHAPEGAGENYVQEQYALCGAYFERALRRAPNWFDYANSAGIAYYYANDKARSLEMGKYAIRLEPNRYEGYQLLLYLFPDVETRPWDVSALLQDGYQRTGREELKPA